jgi:hypothetical protein
MAMGAGRRAAKAIETYLRGGKATWPITEADLSVPLPVVAVGR